MVYVSAISSRSACRVCDRYTVLRDGETVGSGDMGAGGDVGAWSRS